MRKTFLLVSMYLLLAIFLFAGGNSENTQPVQGDTEGRVLVAYFSWAENNDGNFGVDAVSTSSLTRPGNVEDLALFITSMIDSDIFSIQVENPYPANWDDCLARANDERRNGEHPVLSSRVRNIDDYDIVFLGYPNWWYGIPMALYTFFEENNLSGKQIYLFCSHGTGGLARSVDQITEALPESIISRNVFDINEHQAHDSFSIVRDWLMEPGFQPEED